MFDHVKFKKKNRNLFPLPTIQKTEKNSQLPEKIN